MKKRIIKHLGFFLFLIPSLFAFAEDRVEITINGKDIFFVINPNDGFATVTIPESGKYDGIIHIPGEIDYEGKEYPVKEIGKKAFSGSSIEKVFLPSTLETINESAFYDCDLLWFVDMPSAIKIGDYAFSFCMSLDKIELPENLTSLGRSAFSYSGIRTITIPKSVNSIGKNVFAGCDDLDKIQVDESDYYTSEGNSNSIIRKKDNTLIAGCKGTTSVPEGVKSIGEFAFYSCSGLNRISLPSTIELIGESAFDNCDALFSINFPAKLVSIGNSAFSFCSSLRTIHLPDSLERIGRSAFSYSGLDSIVIPKSVVSIGKNVFSGCDRLRAMQVENGNDIYDSRGNTCNAIIEKSSRILIAGCRNTIIPEDEEVYEIGECAFSGSSIKTIYIPSNIKKIGISAFEFCKNLSVVSLSEGLNSIERDAFSFCSSLDSICLPASIVNIGRHAFNYCSSLRSVTSMILNPFDIADDVFGDLPKRAKLWVPRGTVGLYEQASGWNYFKGNIFEQFEMGINELIFEDSLYMLRFYSDNGVLYLESAEGNSCEIYSSTGQIVRVIKLKKGCNLINDLGRGLYIINGTKIYVQ